jgi:hypothetical protein
MGHHGSIAAVAVLVASKHRPFSACSRPRESREHTSHRERQQRRTQRKRAAERERSSGAAQRAQDARLDARHLGRRSCRSGRSCSAVSTNCRRHFCSAAGVVDVAGSAQRAQCALGSRTDRHGGVVGEGLQDAWDVRSRGRQVGLRTRGCDRKGLAAWSVATPAARRSGPSKACAARFGVLNLCSMRGLAGAARAPC